jgi:hypothetical protein
MGYKMTLYYKKVSHSAPDDGFGTGFKEIFSPDVDDDEIIGYIALKYGYNDGFEYFSVETIKVEPLQLEGVKQYAKMFRRKLELQHELSEMKSKFEY